MGSNKEMKNALKTLNESTEEKELARLMVLSQDGDGPSYQQLLQRVRLILQPYIAGLFRKYGLSHQDEKQDVLQEVLLAIHHKRSTFDRQQFFMPWMYAIARYKVIDHLRKSIKQSQNDLPLTDDEVSLFDFSESARAFQDVSKLLATLSVKQRDVLTLVKIDGLSLQEASQKTGFSVADIKVTIHRAIKTLQKQIDEARHENG
jgi:RNA polymerase sigma-70 factor, ECF subfamily